MTLAIIGTRSPTIDYDKWLPMLLSHIDIAEVTQVVSGGAKGIDSYAKRFAEEYTLTLVEYIPEFSKFGRNAALLRNIEIVKAADIVIAFPSNNSRGTFYAIREAEKLNKPVIIINL